MRRTLSVLLVAALVVAIAWWTADLPGRVALNVGGYNIETGAPVAAVLAAIVLILTFAIYRMIAGFLSVPGAWRFWRQRRRRQRGDAAVTRALVTLAAAEGGAARTAAAEARRMLGDTVQTLLLAAEAARQDGDETAAQKVYEAMVERSDAAFLGYRGLFRQALARGDWDEAKRLARAAEAIQPGTAWLRQVRLELAARTGDWAPALELAGPDVPLPVLAVAASTSAKSAEEGERLARRAFRADPAFVPAALAYAARLRGAGREGRCIEVLREAWTNMPHPALAELALRPIQDPLARARAGAGLVRARPEHPESHLLLGRLSLEAGIAGEARRHAKAAIAAGLDDRRAWLLLADIEDGIGGNLAAMRDALRHVPSADPEPAWHCASCHSEQPDWHPACPVCHATASLSWASRPRPVPRPLAMAGPEASRATVPHITDQSDQGAA